MATRKTLKTVVVTGGSSGIGLETAQSLLQTGEYRVVLVGRDDGKLAAAVKELGAASDRVSVVECDLRDGKKIVKAAEKIMALHKTIYGLVNNAGIYPFGGLKETTDDLWDETFDVNLKAAFRLTRALYPALAKHDGGARVVNVSSTAGLLPNHFAMAYSVSKAALVHMSRTLAKELGKDGITVNCVCPGVVRSPMHEAYHSSTRELESFYAKRGAAFPLGRVGEPKDVAGVIKFYLSEDASWVTGDVFVVDGGRLLL